MSFPSCCSYEVSVQSDSPRLSVQRSQQNHNPLLSVEVNLDAKSSLFKCCMENLSHTWELLHIPAAVLPFVFPETMKPVWKSSASDLPSAINKLKNKNMKERLTKKERNLQSKDFKIDPGCSYFHIYEFNTWPFVHHVKVHKYLKWQALFRFWLVVWCFCVTLQFEFKEVLKKKKWTWLEVKK